MPSVEGAHPRTPPRWLTVTSGALLPVVILAAWWGVSAAGVVSSRLLPSPQDVVLAGIDLARRGVLLDDVAISVQRVLTGFAAGSVTGLLLGAGVRRSRTARILVSPLLSVVRAVPTVAWLPVLLLYNGVGETPKVALIAIGAAFPLLTAVSGVDPDDPGHARLEPAIVSGLRAGLAQAWVFLVTAELLHATSGLGFLLIDASRDGRPDRLLVGIVLIVVLARFSDLLMAILEGRLTRPRYRARRRVRTATKATRQVSRSAGC